MGVRTITVTVTVDPSKVGPGLAAAAVEVDRFTARTVAKGAAVDASFGKDFGKVLRGNLSQLSGDVARFTTQTQGLGSLLGSTFASGFKVGGSTAAVVGLGGAAATLAVGLAAAAASAVPFDAAMHNVNSIAQLSDAAFKATEQSVLDLSTTVPQSATQLAKGLYEVESSNFHAADGLHVLDVSAKAASAGLTDTDTATKAITGALNAYGLSAASAGDVSDILFQTVNKGVVTFADVSQQLGDFVGTAAAARVPLQDAASAFAAITLAGVPAAEASTSLNQLLTKILKPTKDLALAFHQLGYESGASALQQKGLQGVIQDIGKVTGGSAEQLVKMFNDVRAARGVLALLSAGGRNYQTAVDGIAESSVRGGATQRAFNEQMKSTQAQLTLLRNDAVKTGIELGLRLLPPFNAFLQMARAAGAEELPFLHAALTRVAPLFQQLFGVIGDIAHILGTLAAEGAPVVKVLAELAGAAVLGPLTLFLQLLHSLTSFLSQHAGIAAAVGAVYALRLLPALGSVTVMLNRMILTPVVLFLNAILTSAGSAETAVRGLAASLTVANVAMAAVAVGIGAYTAGLQKHNEIAAEAKAHVDELTKGFDVLDTGHARDQLAQLQAQAASAAKVGEQYDGFLGTLKAGITLLPFASGEVDKVAESGSAAAQKYAQLNGQFQNFQQNISAIYQQTGIATDTIGRIAKLQNIDLTKPVEESASARKQLIQYLGDLRTQDALTTKAIASNAKIDVEAMADLEKAVQKVVDAAQGAFEKDTDVLGQFADNTVKAAKAQDGLAKARSKTSGASGASALRDEQRIARDRQSIADAEQRAAVSRSRTASSEVSHQQSINRARQKLADDEALIGARAKSGSGVSSSVASAQAKAAAADASANLATLYKQAVASSQRFVQDINSAIQRGLDPAVVTKLLEEGPKKAEPALQAILADHSGRMIRMVNQSEAALANLSGFVAEQARIAALAMNAPTDQYTKDLKSAMALAAQEAATGGKATSDALARSLHISKGEVIRIANEFGITIADQVQNAVNKRGPVLVHANGQVDFSPSLGQAPVGQAIVKSVIESINPRRRRRARGFAVPRADGGPIFGVPGRDTNLAAVTRGEYVQPVAAVQHYGAAFMDAVRTRSLPRFADGGLVGRDGGWLSSVISVSGPRIVPVPVPISTRSSSDNSVTYNIDKVVANSPWELPDAGPRTYSASRGVS